MFVLYSELPRDLQLNVIQKFDMDTRIKAGIIGKLRVPPQLNIAITKSLNMRSKIPAWCLEKYVSQRRAILLPINDRCAYEMYYDRSFWFTPYEPIQGLYTALLYVPLDADL
jgi:hypothetical protein